MSYQHISCHTNNVTLSPVVQVCPNNHLTSDCGVSNRQSPRSSRPLYAPHASVYRRCRCLEHDGRLTSELRRAGTKSGYSFSMTGEAVTSGSHERIEQLDAAVAETIRAYSLPQERDELIAALDRQLEQGSPTPWMTRRGALEEFANRLLEAAATATKPSELIGLLGIRFMRPATRVWALGRQLSLT